MHKLLLLQHSAERIKPCYRYSTLMSRELTINYEKYSTYNQCNQVYKSPNCTCNSPNCTYKSLNTGNSAYAIYYIGVSGVPHLYEYSKLHNQSCQS